MHAQSIAGTDAELKAVKDHLKTSEDDRTAYKDYVQNRFKNMEDVVTQEFKETKTIVYEDRDKIKNLDEKIGLIGAQLSELLHVFNQKAGPSVYEMGTPTNDPARGSRDLPPASHPG